MVAQIVVSENWAWDIYEVKLWEFGDFSVER